MGCIAGLLAQFSPHFLAKLRRQPGRSFRWDALIQLHVIDDDLRATAGKPRARQPDRGNECGDQDEHGNDPSGDSGGHRPQTDRRRSAHWLH